MSHSSYHCNFDHGGEDESEINIEINNLESMIYPEIFLVILVSPCHLQFCLKKLEMLMGLSEGLSLKRSPISGISYVLYD